MKPTPVFLPEEIPWTEEAWWATVHEVARVGHSIATKHQQTKPGLYSVIAPILRAYINSVIESSQNYMR